MDHLYYMKKALRQARKGAGLVSPNPMVGAILVKGDRIISTGYHRYYGGPHAEVDALSNLTKSETRNATLYVNLEPCSHHGKTPPCVDTIIESGISKIMIGTRDPNPLVSGNGIQILKKHGIKTETDILQKECLRLNEAYFKFITQGKPFVTLKIAQTLDGKIATQAGHSQWITSESSRRYVHRMRSETDSVMVGINTILKDDPELTVRHLKGHNPNRIILDCQLRIPLNANVLHHSDSENTILVTTDRSDTQKRKTLRQKGIKVWIVKTNSSNQIDISTLLTKLAEQSIASVMVEGGKGLFTSFIEAGVVDRIISFIAPKAFGKGIDMLGDLNITHTKNALIFTETDWRRIGSDMMFQGRLNHVHRNY